jgi:hypothetical protein
MEKTMPLDKIVPDYRIIYTFPDRRTRDGFCEGKYLELIGAREDFMDSDLDLHINVKGQAKSHIIACNTAAELHGANVHFTCGGNCMADCVKHQSTTGKTCSYCEYVETRIPIS